jgi:hypothetical protein
MFFYGLLDRPKRSLIARQNEQPVTPNVGLRRFLALGIGAAVAVALGGLLKRLFTIGTFGYDGRQYRGPNVQKITPIRPEDEFYQVSKNLVDPNVARDSWRLDIIRLRTSPQCLPLSKKLRCFAFRMASAAAFARTRSGKACRCPRSSRK